MPPYRVAVGAPLGAVAPPPGAGGVGEDRVAVGRGAPAEPVHASPHQVQRGTYGDQCEQYGAELLPVVAVVQVSAGTAWQAGSAWRPGATAVDPGATPAF